MSLDIWAEKEMAPTKGVRRAHGQKRYQEASAVPAHRTTLALHTTSAGVGVVGQMRTKRDGRIAAKGQS